MKIVMLICLVFVAEAHARTNTFVVALRDPIHRLEWSEVLPGLYSNGCSYTTDCFLLGEDGTPVNNYDAATGKFLATAEKIAQINGGVRPVVDLSNLPYNTFFRIHPDYSEAARACRALGTTAQPARLPTAEEYNKKLKYSGHSRYPFFTDWNDEAYWVDAVYEHHWYIDFENPEAPWDQRGVAMMWYAKGYGVNHSDLQESKHQVRCVRDMQ